MPVPGPPTPELPPYRRPVYLAVVALGGAVGAEVRYQLTNVVAPAISAPAITFVINVVGSLLLGVLLESLALRGPDVGLRRTLRLLLGTGFMGGFTTYSTLALDAATYLDTGHWGTGIAYGLGSVVAGVLAAAVGVWLAAAVRGRKAVGEQ
ncbi:putative fluoride ion transporter CrcB [Microlunatus endophyticus]|uniref:Fluoride-specific ion channel FluC n=1 Tax=Microlunatus endophyticus TaxID=1716077 RepID=A0A917W2S5_9ACTN|nr:CrcB family protein [Microlunatus endophyticus]GGL62188.1 putative fluoride ion transporter CrcB [Microlunatus endophyticus]